MHRFITIFVFVSLLFLTVLGGHSQTLTNIIDTFDTNTYPNGTITNRWSNWFGAAFLSLSLDAASDAQGNPASGSLKIAANFPANNQFTVWDGLNSISPALNGLLITNFSCDVRFAAGSATQVVGGTNTFGQLQFGMGTPTYGQDYFINGTVTVAATNTNWVHVSIPLNVNADTNLNNINNLFIHIWSGSSLLGASTLWVDNIAFIGMATNTGTITINYTNTQQRIDGFGASSAWMSGTLATSVADLLFSTNNGVGMSLLRTHIYPDGSTTEGPIAQQAQARGARIWSTPWSANPIYKTTNSPNGGSFVSSVANYSGYASQLAKNVALMKNTYGINLYALSIQNEPDAIVTYESCWWTSQQFHDFIPYLSAALTASNVAATKIMIPEDEGWQWNLATNSMSDPAVSNLVGILGGHNYVYPPFPVTQFGNPCPKPLWETEHYIGNDDSITNGLALAQEMHTFLAVCQVNAYHYWWLTGSGSGSIANNTANPAKRLFVMGNYSKFVRPNFYRIGATNTTVALISAYKDTNSPNFVIVAANPGPATVNQTFTLTNFPVLGTLTQWVTSASLSLSNQGPVNVTNRSFNYVLPPLTVVSFVYTQPVTNPPSFEQPPASQSGVIGGSVTFTPTIGGTPPFAYQWQFNGTNLLNATNATLTLTGLVNNNAGNYTVVVTNTVGSITSAVATLTVLTGPTITLLTTDNFGYSSFDTQADSGGLAASHWSNNTWPAATNNYFTLTYMLRTPAGVGNVTFPGLSLTVSSGGFLNLKGNNGAVMTVNNLILAGGTVGNGNGGYTYGVAGNLNVTANSAFSLANDATRTINVSSTLTGSGTITNGYAANGLGTIVYTGTNTGFTGPMIITAGAVLQAGSQASLGGNPASFNPAQLVLDGGTFQPTASFALTNANSGVNITANGGVLNIPAGLTLSVSNTLTGPGTLLSVGGGTLVLANTNSATGNLIISNGTLNLLGGTTFKNNQLAISNGASLNLTGLTVPLAVSNSISLAGNLVANVQSTGAGSRLIASNLAFGGTLTLSNLGYAFAAGNTFPLFTATNYAGAFAGIVPAVPGPGLFWDTSRLTVNGTLAVAAMPSPLITGWQIGGNQLVLRGTNGGAAGSPFYTLAGTNLLLPFTNWPIVATNLFGPGGGFAITNFWSAGPQMYFLLRLP